LAFGTDGYLRFSTRSSVTNSTGLHTWPIFA
jgi:hypothetical protein